MSITNKGDWLGVLGIFVLGKSPKDIVQCTGKQPRPIIPTFAARDFIEKHEQSQEFEQTRQKSYAQDEVPEISEESGNTSSY